MTITLLSQGTSRLVLKDASGIAHSLAVGSPLTVAVGSAIIVVVN